MIPTGLVNALVAWASDATLGAARIVLLKAERDTLVELFLSGGKAASTLTTAAANGKSFAWSVNLSREDKLAVITQVLALLGEAPVRPSVSYANFSGLER
jgi:hypothetical protein